MSEPIKASKAEGAPDRAPVSTAALELIAELDAGLQQETETMSLRPPIGETVIAWNAGDIQTFE